MDAPARSDAAVPDCDVRKLSAVDVSLDGPTTDAHDLCRILDGEKGRGAAVIIRGQVILRRQRSASDRKASVLKLFQVVPL